MNTVNTKVLPQDYKKTEFGQIPDDWDVKRLDEVFVISAGRDLVKEDYYPIRDHTHKIPIYSNSLENGGLYGYTKSPRYEKNCVTITARGTIGKANYRDSKFDAIGRLLVLKPKLNIDCYFVSEFINNKLYFSIESTGVPQLTAPQASKYLVILPKINEQIGISKVLSDLDSLIQKTEKLIEKKQKIRQGMTHDLLSGIRRLKGFTESWKELTLDEVAGRKDNIVDGPFGSNLKNSDYITNGVPVLQGLNITGDKFVWKDIRYISENKARQLYRSNVRVSDLLVIKIGSVGYSAVVNSLENYNFAIIPANLLRFRCEKGKYDIRFVHYVLSSDTGKQKLRDLAGNTAQPAISLKGFRQLTFRFPPNYDEQTKIADIISDMDIEIEEYIKKLVKYNQIKQGTMQVLLTGKIRLNPNSYAKPITQSRTN